MWITDNTLPPIETGFHFASIDVLVRFRNYSDSDGNGYFVGYYNHSTHMWHDREYEISPEHVTGWMYIPE